MNAPYGEAPAGECGLCGYFDKRHRMWDMIAIRFKAGESIDELAKDYDYTRTDMEQWLRLAMLNADAKHKRKRKKLLSGGHSSE